MSDGPAARRSPGEPWGGVRPFSIKTKLGALVVVSVLITTGLSVIAVHTKTELRFITVFSMIATLLITQFVAHSLTAPLDEMNAVARSISHGDYTRRVRENRRDELGDLAETINVMADELEAQERQRKELVANVSHELRTPIAGLRAVLENVVDGVSAADPETMRTALKQTERLGRLVETLLDLSRLDNGVLPLKTRRFEVWPYLSGVLKEANMVASARGGIASGSGSHTRTDVHLHLDVSPPELTALADPERIHQVVANLIDNAVKHSPAHGRVTVKARRGSLPESLELEVLDEGPGIPKSEWHQIFERFNRGAVSAPTDPAATAVRASAWRSPAGRWICTAAGSVWPNPTAAAGLSSPFRDCHPCQVDVKFGPEPQDPRRSALTDTCDQAQARAVRTFGPQRRVPSVPEPRLFPAISMLETHFPV